MMNEKEINEHMARLLSGKAESANELERQALEHFKAISNEIAQKQNKLQQIQFEVEQLRQGIQRAIGRQEAYIQLLVVAENTRRGGSNE